MRLVAPSACLSTSASSLTISEVFAVSAALHLWIGWMPVKLFCLQIAIGLVACCLATSLSHMTVTNTPEYCLRFNLCYWVHTDSIRRYSGSEAILCLRCLGFSWWSLRSSVDSRSSPRDSWSKRVLFAFEMGVLLALIWDLFAALFII